MRQAESHRDAGCASFATHLDAQGPPDRATIYNTQAVFAEFPTTQAQLQAAATGRVEPNPLFIQLEQLSGQDVLPMETERQGSCLWLPQIQAIRCPRGQLGTPPQCEGDACLPCYHGHVGRRHPAEHRSFAVHQMILEWQAILGRDAWNGMAAFVDPLVLHSPRAPRPSPGGNLEGHISGFIVHTARLLLQHPSATRYHLGQHGGVRVTPQEAMRQASRQQILTGFGLDLPHCISHRTYCLPSGKLSQGITLTVD